MYHIKKALLKSSLAIACFFLSTAFVVTPTHTGNNTETVVSIVQENNDLTVSVKTLNENNIKFYMFSVEGRLIKELNIQGSRKISITQLEKGIYIYDFFCKDKRIKNGQIALR